jgi:YHS domain-containing protein
MSQVKDPVCGMTVDTDTAVRLSHGTHTHYFCSETCRRTFEADPAAFGDGHSASAGRGDVELERHEPPYTVSDSGFTAPKFGSAGSGGAEFEPLPEAHDDRPRDDRDGGTRRNY